MLEPCPARRGRLGYAHPLAYYVPIYGTKLRQLKNWLDRGRPDDGKVDLPPLDQPGEMPAWWSRVYPDRTVPEKLHQAAAKAKHEALGLGAVVPPKNSSNQSSEQKAAAPNAATPPAAAAPLREKIENFESVAEMDLPAAVARQRRALAVLTSHYEKALGDPNTSESDLTLRANRVDKCIERLRKLEGTLDELRKSREELIDVATMREELQLVHSAMAGNLEAELIDVLNVARATARTFVDRHFAQLRQCRFTAGTEPRPQPAAA